MTKILFSAVFTAIFALLGMATIVAGMRKQGVAISGKFLCGSIPVGVNSTKVKLVDIDTGKCLKNKFEIGVKGFGVVEHECNAICKMLLI